ncbi:CRAL-TRIO domain-containing protein [Apodospora peruviana]|uniref:CRAL-TRIO domain-containing protein n=1 Tax=Apodospora peruviana TaxID=516989 RepID=A0AAE0HUW5_9PEZI|nr:CRAL-TRIO domain-containing protein [Apodospora peruviana]
MSKDKTINAGPLTDKTATGGPLPGHLGNLTADEKRKLQEAWSRLLKLCHDADKETTNGTATNGTHETPAKPADQNGHTPANGHHHHHHHHHHLHHHQHTENPAVPPSEFRQLLWNFVLADHADVLVLRFLRARKWDINKAMDMLISALNWRHEHRLDEDIVRTGDRFSLTTPLTPDEKGFMAQYRSGKAYVRGSDKEGRPVFIIKVKLHDPKLQSPEAMERFVLHNIETIRSMIRHPDEKAALIFDLTGFGLKNMDFHVVKFLVQVFEARYPEYLGVVLIHKAPWVFWGVWSIIKPWLDPVIASKINFTSSNSDMEKFISQENLQKCYGGKDTFEYKYIDPVEAAGEDRTKDEEKKAKLQNEREELMRRFEGLTEEWAKLDPDSAEGKQKDVERGDLARELRKSFWQLDPYVRARTYYHRAGVIGADGTVDLKAAR